MGHRNDSYELRPLSSQQKWLVAQFKRSLREVASTKMVSELGLGHLRAASNRLMSQAAEHGPVRYLSDFQFFAYWVVRAPGAHRAGEAGQGPGQPAHAGGLDLRGRSERHVGRSPGGVARRGHLVLLLARPTEG